MSSNPHKSASHHFIKTVRSTLFKDPQIFESAYLLKSLNSLLWRKKGNKVKRRILVFVLLWDFELNFVNEISNFLYFFNSCLINFEGGEGGPRADSLGVLGVVLEAKVVAVGVLGPRGEVGAVSEVGMLLMLLQRGFSDKGSGGTGSRGSFDLSLVKPELRPDLTDNFFVMESTLDMPHGGCGVQIRGGSALGT